MIISQKFNEILISILQNICNGKSSNLMLLRVLVEIWISWQFLELFGKQERLQINQSEKTEVCR